VPRRRRPAHLEKTIAEKYGYIQMAFSLMAANVQIIFFNKNSHPNYP